MIRTTDILYSEESYPYIRLKTPPEEYLTIEKERDGNPFTKDNKFVRSFRVNIDHLQLLININSNDDIYRIPTKFKNKIFSDVKKYPNEQFYVEKYNYGSAINSSRQTHIDVVKKHIQVNDEKFLLVDSIGIITVQKQYTPITISNLEEEYAESIRYSFNENMTRLESIGENMFKSGKYYAKFIEYTNLRKVKDSLENYPITSQVLVNWKFSEINTVLPKVIRTQIKMNSTFNKKNPVLISQNPYIAADACVKVYSVESLITLKPVI